MNHTLAFIIDFALGVCVGAALMLLVSHFADAAEQEDDHA